MVLLPQAAWLLVQNVGTHGKYADDRVHVDIPNFGGFVSRNRKQMRAIRTPTNSIVSLAYSQCTHFLSCLSIIDVYLAISAGHGKSVLVGKELHTIDKGALVTNCKLELKRWPLKECGAVNIAARHQPVWPAPLDVHTVDDLVVSRDLALERATVPQKDSSKLLPSFPDDYKPLTVFHPSNVLDLSS